MRLGSLSLGIGLAIPPPAPGGGGGTAAVIDGTGSVGQNLWAEGVAPFQWKRDGVNIGGATAQSYTVIEADDTADVTCVDASGLASNAITCTWVRKLQDGTPAILDIDRANDRYWHNGTIYNRTDFQNLSWVPNDITSLISATAWTTGTLPFPEFNQTSGVVLCSATLNDTGADNGCVIFGAAATDQFGYQARWAQAANNGRTFSTVGNVNQASMNDTTLTAGQQFTGVFKYKANDIWQIRQDGVLNFDAACSITSADRMHIGSSVTGTALADGSIDRVTFFSGDVPPGDIQIILGYDIAILKYGLGENDGSDSRDVFGDGYKALINTKNDGSLTVYRQQQRGVFTVAATGTANPACTEVEGCIFVDYKGDGDYGIAVMNQDVGNIYLYTTVTPSDFTSWNQATPIQASRPKNQDLVPIRVSGDDRDTLYYTWEGTSGGNGGVNKLRWDGAAWTDTAVKQINGAFGISDAPQLANGDLLFSTRENANGAAVGGIHKVALDGTGYAALYTQAGEDVTHLDIGDFFGNGNEDIVFCRGGNDNVSEVYILDAANSYAKTTITIGHVIEYNVKNAGFQINGRDAIFAQGGTYTAVWAWNGAAWAEHHQLTGQQSGMKCDDAIHVNNIFRVTGTDLISPDSINGMIVALKVAP